jgi:MFS family permease
MQNLKEKYRKFETYILSRPKLLMLILILLNISSGILFGYGMSIGNVVLYPMANDFQELDVTNITSPIVSNFVKSSVQSSYLLGNVLGPLIAPIIALYVGKFSMSILAILSVGTVFGLVFSVNIWMVIAFRALHGICVGFITQISTRYVFELSPPHHRGITGVFYFLGTTGGGLIAGIAFFLNYVQYNWRIMFSFSLVWSIGVFIVSMILPEVPSEKDNEGSKVPELTWSEILSEFRKLKLMVYFNCFLCIFMFQFGGINAVMSFLPQIIQELGYYDLAYIAIGTCIVGFVNMVYSLVATFIVQKLGRKTMVVGGGVIMFVGNIGVALSGFFLPQSVRPIFGITFITIFLFGNNCGINAVIFFIFNELFPPKISRIGSAIMTSANHVIRLFIVLLTLPIQGVIGQPTMFIMFAVCNVIFGGLILFLLPETKVKKEVPPVEEMELEETSVVVPSHHRNTSHEVDERAEHADDLVPKDDVNQPTDQEIQDVQPGFTELNNQIPDSTPVSESDVIHTETEE